MELTLSGRPVVAGVAEGLVLVSDEPLSFWGGYDPASGEIIDRRHPLSGKNAAGCILAIPFTRGSSTSTAILLESVRQGSRPAALLCTANDPFLALAAVVADELWGISLPVVGLDAADFARLADGMQARIEQDGTVTIQPA